MVKISIIIPIYNENKFLEQSINSVLNQSLKDIEIICVDCGSNDESKNLLKTLSDKFNCIKIFYKENISLGNARNYAMSKSKGKYISFINMGDFYYNKNALEGLYDVANKNNADMICGNINESSPIKEDYLNKCYYFDKYFQINPEEYGLPIAFYKNIYKKSFLDKNNIQFEDSNNYQDPVFLSKVLTNLNIIYGAPIELYSHNSNVSNLYGNLNSPTKKLDHLTQFKKTFDILKKDKFNSILDEFKLELIDYFYFSQKNNDLYIYETTLDIFGKKPKYFENKFEKHFNLFLSYHMVHKISFENNEEFFQESKKDIIILKLLHNELLPEHLLKNLTLLVTSDNYGEYTHKLHEFKMNIITCENEILISKRNSINDSINNMKSFNSLLIQNNDINAKNIDLKNRIDAFSEDNEKLTSEYSLLSDNNEKLKNRNNLLSEDKDKLVNEIYTLTNNNKKLLNKNVTLLKENNKLKNKMHDLTANNKSLEHNIMELNKEKEKIQSSNSWKVTSPLRFIRKHI